jgi:hypothetical protein
MDRRIEPGSTLALFVVPPVLLVLGLLSWYVSDRLVVIGPFDRAQIGWGLTVPLMALAPGAAAVAGTLTRRPDLARRLVWTVSILSGVVAWLWLASSITFMDCRDVTNRSAVFIRVLPTALAVALAFAIGARAARLATDRGHLLVALVLGAGGWFGGAVVATAVFFVSFPPLACAAPS